MARPTRGAILEHEGKDGKVYRSLRFSAGSKRYRVPLGPVSATEAESTLRHTLADVERGVWKPPVAIEAPAEPSPVPSFHTFAEEWWTRNSEQFAPKTREDYDWRLNRHLVPYFGEMRLDAISYDTVERYIAAKVAEGEEIRKAAADGKPIMEEITDRLGRTFVRPSQACGPRAINMTLVLLGSILERAVERELIDRNPARGKDRRVRERAPTRPQLDAAGQIAALLEAASDLDHNAQEQAKHIERRTMLATLVFAGLRIGELQHLRWRDVDLATGWLRVGDSKTDAGRRRVKIRGALRDELLRIRRSQATDEFVFPTARGGETSATNLRNRVLKPAVKRANERLAAADQPPLPDKLTPHSLRRTFASVLYALGETPPVVMQELGHSDPGLALKVYAQSMRRGEDEIKALRALVEGGVMANGGQRALEQDAELEDAEAA